MIHHQLRQCLGLLLFVLSCSVNSNAQITWFLPGDHWTFYGFYGWSGIGLEEISVEPQDTILKGKIYKALLRTAQPQHYRDYRFARQEGHKIWVWDNWLSGELLLYDFSAEVGDTIMVNSPNYGYVVTKIGTWQLGQTQHITQSIRWLGWTANTSWGTSLLIEGIGAVQSPEPFVPGAYVAPCYLFLDEPPTGAVDGTDRYFCHFESDAGIYTAVVNRCAALSEQAPQEAVPDVYPNPSTGTIYIDWQEGDGPLHITLSDVQGRPVLQHTGAGSITIETDFKGLAFLQIVSKAQKMLKKVVFVP